MILQILNELGVKEFEVSKVELPTGMGRVSILPNHTDTLLTLSSGKMVWSTVGGIEGLTLTGGVVEVTKNKLTVLALSEDNGLVTEKIGEAKEFAEKGLIGKELPPELIEIEKEIKFRINKKELTDSF